jgi:hypothetical protein
VARLQTETVGSEFQEYKLVMEVWKMTPHLAKVGGCLVCALLMLPAVALAGPVVDGQNIPTEFGSANLLATQRFQTGFGDDTSGDQWGWGSELDQLFVANDDSYLYVGLTGNLENNGNCIGVFIDVDGGKTGVNTLYTRTDGGVTPIPGLPRYLAGDAGGGPGLDYIMFDSGFRANYVLGWSGGSPPGSQSRTYYLVNWTTLDINDMGENHTNDVCGMITSGHPTASGPAGTLNDYLATASLGILGAADNSGVDGVEGCSDPNHCGLAVNDPATQTTGLEFAIPLDLLGVGIGDSVCLFTLVSGSDGWISNQLLPPDDASKEFNNIGNRNGGTELLEFGTIPGQQYACYTLVEPPVCPNPGASGSYCSADINPSGPSYCVIDLQDLGVLLATYGKCPGDPGYDPVANLVENDPPDGCIDLADLGFLLAQYGDDCN